jgi:hypothetical protein
MKAAFCLLTFLTALFYSCNSDKDTVINEIIVKDTVYINPQDTVKELGGLRLNFVFQNEFGQSVDSIIQGTTIDIPNLANVNISAMNERGEVLIDGLISGRTYGIEISHKGNPMALIKADRIGSNVYLDFNNFLPIVDISQTEMQSVTANMQIQNNVIEGINFDGFVRGVVSDPSQISRGMVVFMSRYSDVSPVNHEFAIGKSEEKSSGSNSYGPELLVPNLLIKNILNIQEGDTLYYVAHGGTGTLNNSGSIAGYNPPSATNQLFLSQYPNVNPSGINGYIVYEK